MLHSRHCDYHVISSIMTPTSGSVSTDINNNYIFVSEDTINCITLSLNKVFFMKVEILFSVGLSRRSINDFCFQVPMD